MNIKLKTNLMLFVLVFVTVLSCGITAYAQISQSPSNSNIKYMYNSELDKAYSYTSYDNWYDEHEYYGKCSVSGGGSYWATAAIKTLMKKGALYGIEHNGKKFIPAGNYIMGNDALSLAIFFHWPKEQKNRAAVYSNPQNVFENYDTYNILDSADYTNGSFLKRKDAALILAGCVQIKSGGAASLSNYSSTGVGYYSNGKKLDGFSANNYEDTSSVNSLTGIYKQAFSLLMDMDVCQGKIVYDEDFESSTKLAPNDNITYEEFYCWLVNVSEAPIKVPDSYTLKADLSMSATSATLNYKDFLEKSTRGCYATLKATLDASKSVAKKNNSVIDIENYDYTISETKPNNVNGKDYTTGKMSNTVKFPKEYTYWVDTILAKDITSSTDKTKSKDQVELTLRNDKNKGDYTYDITYNGSVTVYATLGDDGLQSKTATATTTGQVILENKAPVVDCEIYSTADVDEAYKRDFFYVGTPIKIKDYCWDKEDETPKEIQYKIEYKDDEVASSKNFDNEKRLSSYVSKFTGDDDERSHTITFKKTGTYRITITAIDEMKKQSMETFTIYVSGTPQPPVAKLIGPDYGYMNTNITFTDASTDPNDGATGTPAKRPWKCRKIWRWR